MQFNQDDINFNKEKEVGTLELLEERANVIKDKITQGVVTLRKQTLTRTVNVPVELTEEQLVIEVVGEDPMLAGDYLDKDVIAQFSDTVTAPVMLNGKPLHLGEQATIVLSRETAVITKKTHTVQEVALHTHKDTKTHTLATELRHEELVVDEKYYDNTQQP